jgi:hypothetical protein
MAEEINSVEDLDHDGTARLVVDFFQRMIIHYALWFTEVRHQMGMPKALEVLDEASSKSIALQIRRISKKLGIEMDNGLPAPLTSMSKKDLLELADTMAANWLTNDGVWFQAVEFSSGLNDAKRCNDSCWAHFSPVEAWSIRKMLDLPDQPGIDGLKRALNFRLYSRINRQSIIADGPDSVILQMNDCRVQSTRKRKGLEDYACKSVGLVEFPYFARSIDPRITTECIGCPPDEHPDEWYCAWRFTLNQQ